MSVTAIIQARMGSTRLPRKAMWPLADRPVLSWVIRAAQLSNACARVVVATTTLPEDDELAAYCHAQGIACVRGSTDDVLDRFITTLDEYPTRTVVRLTADCPMLDPAVIGQAVSTFEAMNGAVDYLSTVVRRCLPRGLDVEVVDATALRRAAKEAHDFHRVHVTSLLYTYPERYRVAGLVFAPDNSDLRVTLDTPQDAALLEALALRIGDRAPAWREVVEVLRSDDGLRRLNADVQQKILEEG